MSIPNLICDYGCNQPATTILKNGRPCCKSRPSGCPILREVNRQATKAAYDNGKRLTGKERYDALPTETKQRMAWSKGLTKETNDSVRKQAEWLAGKKKTSDQEKLKKLFYKEQCNFNISSEISKIDGYELLKTLGMYHKILNPNGVVRDHKISVNYGFKNNIDPKIISHPANCQFLTHKDNAKKTFKNSCTLEQLLENIEKWNREGN